MIASLREMVAPLTEQEFLDCLQAGTITFQRAADRNRFAGLIDWQRLHLVIESGGLPPDELTITRHEAPIPPAFYRQGAKVCRGNLTKLIASGGSAVARHLDLHVPALAALCADVRSHVDGDVMAGAIVTHGPGGAIPWHFDPYDLAILQIEGAKHWTVRAPALADSAAGDECLQPPNASPVFDGVLETGDFLFVPAGHWHHCHNESPRSLHVGIFLGAARPRFADRCVVARDVARDVGNTH